MLRSVRMLGTSPAATACQQRRNRRRSAFARRRHVPAAKRHGLRRIGFVEGRVSWPPPGWRRWAGRLLLALPLAALAGWAQHRGYAHPELALIEHRASLVRSGGASLAGIRYGYPPLATVLAIVLPDGKLSLSIVTCLFSAVILAYVIGRLLRRASVLTTIIL